MKLLLLILLLAMCAQAQYNTSIHSSQPEYGNFNFQYGAFNVNGETQQDHVYRMGWNCGPGGTAVIPGLSAGCMEFERHYRPGGPLDPREWMEFHIVGITRTGTLVRGLSFMFDENTGTWIQVFRSSNLNLLDDHGVQTFQFVQGGLIAMNHSVIRHLDNNANWLIQHGTTGAQISIAKVDSSNSIELGGGTQPVKAPSLLLKDGATWLNVSIGSADSCGTGYRCLKVPNN